MYYGPEYASSEFKAWAEKRGILIHFIQPGKPAQNRFIERFNRTYREDILDMYLFESLVEVEQITKRWMQSYNEERPHESLGKVAPVDFARAREISISLARYQAAMLKQQKLD